MQTGRTHKFSMGGVSRRKTEISQTKTRNFEVQKSSNPEIYSKFNIQRGGHLPKTTSQRGPQLQINIFELQ